MADFKAGQLSTPNTQFTRVSPREQPDFFRDKAATAVATGAGIAGGAAARSNAGDLVGADLSLAEVNEQARLVEKEIESAFQDERDRVEGPIPLTGQRISELKDIALTEFADNDRVLKALRDRGTISTVEARARRRLNLQREMSNPINALFRKDFMNAAADLTGGGEGASNSFLDFTPEEKEAMAIQEAVSKEKIRVTAEITGIAASTGQPFDVVEREFRERSRDQEKLKTFQAKQNLSDIELAEKFSIVRNDGSRGMAAQILQANMANQRRGLGSNDTATLTQAIEQSYGTMIEAVNSSKGSAKWKDEEQKRADQWRTDQLAFLKTYDANDMDKKEIEALELWAQKMGWQHLAPLMGLKVLGPEMAQTLITSSGSLEQALNNAIGGEGGTKFIDATRAVGQATDFVSKKGIDDPGLVMDMLNSERGITYITGEEAQGNENVRTNLKDAYLQSTAKSLNTLNGTFSIMKSPHQGALQNEIVTAMDIARGKIRGIRDTLVGTNELDPATMITAERRRRFGTSKVKQIEEVYISFPDALERNKDELMQMYRAVANHPWAWSHVEDQYIDAADAFSGYMRGEWEFTPTVEGGASPNRNPINKGASRPKAPKTGRVQGEPPVIAREIDVNQDVVDKTIAFENPEGFVSEFTQTDDGGVGQAPNIRDGKAYPYMFHVPGKGWEVDIGFGHLIKSGLSQEQAQALVQSTKPVDESVARQRVEDHLSNDQEAILKRWPNIEGAPLEALTMMKFQGADARTWKRTSRAIANAVDSDDPVDWFSVQAHLLNSEWATTQTPDRALATVHSIFPDTDIEILKTMLLRFQNKRGGE